MYLSAKILQILSWDSTNSSLIGTLGLLDYRVSSGSIISIVLCFTIFMISKKYRLTPHCITTGLLIQSLVAPLVAVLYSYDVISLFWKVNLNIYSKRFTTDHFTFSEPDSRVWSVLCPHQFYFHRSYPDHYHVAKTTQKVLDYCEPSRPSFHLCWRTGIFDC